jgi:hypothetical protein
MFDSKVETNHDHIPTQTIHWLVISLCLVPQLPYPLLRITLCCERYFMLRTFVFGLAKASCVLVCWIKAPGGYDWRGVQMDRSCC